MNLELPKMITTISGRRREDLVCKWFGRGKSFSRKNFFLLISGVHANHRRSVSRHAVNPETEQPEGVKHRLLLISKTNSCKWRQTCKEWRHHVPTATAAETEHLTHLRPHPPLNRCKVRRHGDSAISPFRHYV